jgi:hypothetical protein
MNPLQWAQDNIFYTDDKKKKINQAARVNAGAYSDMKPGVTYGDSSYSQQQKTDSINAGVRSTFGLDKKPTTVIGPGGPGGFGMGSDNTVSTPKPAPTSKTNNASDINKRLDQQKAERAAALARTKGGYDHSSGSYEGQTSERQILPADETRDVPGSGGGKQTGKNLGGGGTPIDMSRSFNSLLAGIGQTPFGGTQLPTAMGNPYTATYKQTPGFGVGTPDIGGMNGATYDSEGGTNALSATNLQDMAPFNPSATLIEGGSERIAQQSTGITSGRLSDALEGVKTQEANREMTPERRQLMARAAFMNGDDSMSGLKARDAVQGKVYAGGQHYISGESGDDKAIAINPGQARDISNGKSSAQSLLAAHIDKNKDVSKDTPAESQNPLSEAGSAVRSGFAAGAKTDFALNNNSGTPQVGVGPVVKPSIVENADLTGEKGKEYLRKLDAGEFF